MLNIMHYYVLDLPLCIERSPITSHSQYKECGPTNRLTTGDGSCGQWIVFHMFMQGLLAILHGLTISLTPCGL